MELSELPKHELQRQLKEKKIKFKPADNKAALISMLETGKTIHVEKPKTQAPNLIDSKKEKSAPILPVEIKPQLEEMKSRGLTWEIDEESNCVTFTSRISTCANLDGTAQGILKTAKDSFGGALPVEQGWHGQYRA